MDLNTILFAVVMVGVAGFIIFEAVKSISEEFNFEIPSIGFPKISSSQILFSESGRLYSKGILPPQFLTLSLRI